MLKYRYILEKGNKRMFYQRELDFLKKVFIKCGISLKVLPTKEFVESVDIAPNIFYRLTDVLGLHYIFFLLPDTPESTLLLIGPFESSDMTAETSSLMTSLDVFCETIWGNKSSYKELKDLLHPPANSSI